jgi:hypothetical protein
MSRVRRPRPAPPTKSHVIDKSLMMSGQTSSRRLPLRWAMILLGAGLAAALVLLAPAAAAALGVGVTVAIALDQLIA